jgi:tetratricopeptide (TPR) repeat protein
VKSQPEELKPDSLPWQRLLLIALPLLTFIAYLPALHGDFIWDDDRHVWANLDLRDVPGLQRIWTQPSSIPQWYPLTHTTFWVEYQLWGNQTLGYHIDNLLLHIANALLVWRLLKVLNLPAAPLAALIFALHPIQAESVAWISERMNCLSTFFALLSVLTFFTREQLRPFPLKTFLLFLCAMLSKTVAGTVPPVILVIHWWKTGHVRRRDFLQMIPFFVVSLLLGRFTSRTEVLYVGASGPDWDLSFPQRLLIAGRAIWFYLSKILWPANLMFSYPRWQLDAANLRLYLFPAAAILLLASAWLLRHRIGRGPLAALLIFGGVLAPALGFLNTYPMRFSFVADHFQYAAGIPIIVLISSILIHYLPQKLLAPMIAIPLLLLTWHQSHIYAGPQTLWRDVIARNPNSWLADENLAVALTFQPNSTQAQLEEALTLYQRVSRLRPQHEKLHVNWAEALFKLGRWEECLPHYRLAIRSPGVSMEIINDRMGTALLRLDRPEEARPLFNAALKTNPRDTDAIIGLGELNLNVGQIDEAVKLFQRALAIDPQSSAARKDLADALASPHAAP